MTKKKQQTAKKAHKTYRPKFAPKPTRGTQEEEGILTSSKSFRKDLKVPVNELPIQYKNPGSSAYRFPSALAIILILIILFIIGYLLF